MTIEAQVGDLDGLHSSGGALIDHQERKKEDILGDREKDRPTLRSATGKEGLMTYCLI